MSYFQVFYNDIRNLLSMEDMWRFRDKPVPLDFDLIQSNQFVLRGHSVSAVDLSADGVTAHLNGSAASHNGISATSTPKESATRSDHGLKDQRSLSLQENLALFVSR